MHPTKLGGVKNKPHTLVLKLGSARRWCFVQLGPEQAALRLQRALHTQSDTQPHLSFWQKLPISMQKAGNLSRVLYSFHLLASLSSLCSGLGINTISLTVF